jgi:hypothetical protein
VNTFLSFFALLKFFIFLRKVFVAVFRVLRTIAGSWNEGKEFFLREIWWSRRTWIDMINAYAQIFILYVVTWYQINLFSLNFTSIFMIDLFCDVHTYNSCNFISMCLWINLSFGEICTENAFIFVNNISYRSVSKSIDYKLNLDEQAF